MSTAQRTPRATAWDIFVVPVLRAIHAVQGRLVSMTGWQKALVAFYCLLTIVGEVSTIIAMNFWLTKFPSTNGAGGPFATQMSSGLFYWLFFVVAWLGWWWYVRPQCTQFMWSRRGAVMLFLMGMTDLTSNIVATYATDGTPEVLQAFLSGTVFCWVLLLNKLFRREKRTLLSPVLIASVAATIGGVAVSTASVSNQRSTASSREWSAVYALSAVLYAAWCVLQQAYILFATDLVVRQHRENALAAAEDAGAPSEADSGTMSPRSFAIAGITIKLFMLLCDTTVQVLATLPLLPTDALPWYGTSPTVHAAWTAFQTAFTCVFTCPGNTTFFVIYSLGYVVSYAGDAYVNHYSATLGAMLIELSAPLTAIILITCPSLDVYGGNGPIGYQIGAALLMTLGALMYTGWEEMSSGELAASDSPTTASDADGYVSVPSDPAEPLCSDNKHRLQAP